MTRLFIFLAFILTGSCIGQTSTATALRYDKTKNITTLVLIPYGNYNIPGEWKKKAYNDVSGQHFLQRSDSAVIALTKNPKEWYPFYKKNSTEKDFLTSFYKWDSDYHESKGRKTKILQDSTDSGFIVWQLTQDKSEYIFLYAANKKFCFNLMSEENKMTEEQRIDFLKKLLRSNRF
jgi:hypothetical protein